MLNKSLIRILFDFLNFSLMCLSQYKYFIIKKYKNINYFIFVPIFQEITWNTKSALEIVSSNFYRNDVLCFFFLISRL